jgi:hypothetical protein
VEITMTHRELDTEPAAGPEVPPFRGPPAAYDIVGFCRAHSISESFFYKLVDQGRGPRLMRVGRRVLVSAESAAAWRAAMEEETAA